MAQPDSGPVLETADVDWDENGVPQSRRFGDVYFNRENGLDESRYVFLRHNRLRERFQTLAPGQSFVVAESGFGVGLNFLATCQLWAEAAPAGSILHFVSVERYPLSRGDISSALDYWPELTPWAGELLDFYPSPVAGLHRLVLAGGAIRLSLYFGDVLEGWKEMDFRADAWFLDGFAPSLNPDMWQDQCFAEVRRHSNPCATLATFTSAGRIRRSLVELGFAMEKITGYGQKREMLAGQLAADRAEPELAPQKKPVVIVGAGIAGCLLARNLADRGVPVRLIDQSLPGSGASGNRQGALYVKLGVEPNYQTGLALSALLFSQRYYRTFAKDHWHQTGLLHLASGDHEADRQARFLKRNHYPEDILRPVSRQEATELAGIPVPCGGLWFPRSGWLEPASLCASLIDHPLILGQFDKAVTALRPHDRGWQLEGDGETDQAATVVLCTGHLTQALLPEGDRYRFKPIRGQVSYIDQSQTRLPRTVLCGPRYLNPPQDGVSVVGATFDLRCDDPAPRIESHRENMQVLNDMLPGLEWQNEASSLDGRVCFRCTTHDYQPVAGAVNPDQTQGLYLFTGLGSKGLSYAPLLAEYLADYLCGQPGALPVSLAKRLGTERCRFPA